MRLVIVPAFSPVNGTHNAVRSWRFQKDWPGNGGSGRARNHRSVHLRSVSAHVPWAVPETDHPCILVREGESSLLVVDVPVQLGLLQQHEQPVGRYLRTTRH